MRYRDQALLDAAAGLWPLDELRGTVLDVTGRNDGTVVAPAIYGAPGPILADPYTRALRVAGGYVTLGNPAAFQLTTGTIEAWVRSSTPGASYRGAIVKPSAFGLLVKDGVAIAYDYGAAADRSSGVNIADGLWHHLALTFQSGVGSGSVVYVDGIARLTTTIAVASNANALVLGAGDAAGTTQLLAGDLAYPAIYPTVLTAARILAHWNAGVGNPLDQRVADWRFYLHNRGDNVRLRNLTAIARHRQLSYRVNTPAALSFVVPSDAEQVATAHSDGYPMITKGRRYVLGYRLERQANGTDIYVPRYAGRIWTVQDTGDANGQVQTTVACLDPRIVLRKRFPLVDEPVAGPTIGAVSYVDEDGGIMLRGLVLKTNQYDSPTGLHTGTRLYRERILEHIIGGADPAGLAIYWRVEDDTGNALLRDYSGLGNHGTVGGTFGISGAVLVKGALVGDANKGGSADGATNFVDYGPTATLASIGDTFTWEAWLKPALPLPPASGWSLDEASLTGAGGRRIKLTSTGAIELSKALTTTTQSVIATSTIPVPFDGYYHHVVVTKTGATVKLYIDNVDVTGAVSNQTLSGIVAQHRMLASTTDRFYRGAIDEVALYSTALSATQVANHYRAGKQTLEPGFDNVFQATPVRNGDTVYQNRDLLSIAGELGAATSGFDFDARPLDTLPAGYHAVLDVFARQGVDRPQAYFDYLVGRNNVRRMERLESMEKYANYVLAVGGIPDSTNTRLTSGVYSSAEVTALGVMRSISAYGDIVTQSLLDALTTEELAFAIASGELIQWVPAPGRHPRPWDDFYLGDTIRARSGVRLRKGFDAIQRVYGFDIVLDEEARELLNGVYTQRDA